MNVGNREFQKELKKVLKEPYKMMFGYIEIDGGKNDVNEGNVARLLNKKLAIGTVVSLDIINKQGEVKSYFWRIE